jgi:hypothetical protein
MDGWRLEKGGERSVYSVAEDLGRYLPDTAGTLGTQEREGGEGSTAVGGLGVDVGPGAAQVPGEYQAGCRRRCDGKNQ